MDDLALTLRVAKDTRSAVGNLDYRISKLLDGRKTADRDGSLIIRTAACKLIASAYKQSPIAVARQFWGDDIELKSAVAPAQTTVAGWAAELLAVVTSELSDRLLPETVFAQLRQLGLALTFSGDDIPKIPNILPVASGAWVAEGAPLGLGALVVTATTLPVKKCASLIAATRELLRGVPGNIEAALQTVLTEDLLLLVDATLLDALPGNAARPAGLLNGIAGLTPAAVGTGNTADRRAADLGALINAIAPALRPVLIVANPQAMAIGRDTLIPVIRAPFLAAGTAIMVDAAAFASATGTVDVQASEEAVIHQANPASPIGTPGIPPPDAPAVVAAPTSSLWQTASFALKTVFDVNWSLRRPNAAAWMAGVSW